MFGLSEQNWRTVQELLILPLKALGCRVFIYGSRANGSHKKFSDLDVGVEGPVSEKQLSLLRSQLEESDLPIKVDLVRLTDLPGSFIEKVRRDKKEI